MRVVVLGILVAALAASTSHAIEPRVLVDAWRGTNFQVQAVALDGEPPRALNLSNSQFSDFQPVPTPDGQWIYFTRFVGSTTIWLSTGVYTGQFDIWRMRADGTEQEAITRTPQHEYAPSVSPDGTKLHFTRELPQSGYDETAGVVANLDGSDTRELPGLHPDEAEWSPDGTRLVYTRYHAEGARVEIYDIATGAITALTTDAAVADYPEFSPDGRLVAMTYYAAGDEDSEIAIVPAEGGPIQELTSSRSYEWSPAWSPDGRQILFGSSRGGNGVFVVRPDGAGERMLFSLDSAQEPAWLGTPPLLVPPQITAESPPSPAPSASVLTVVLRGGLLRARRGRITTRVRCAADRPCSGRLAVLTAAGPPLPLATATYRIAGGRTERVTMRLTAHGRRTVRRRPRAARLLALTRAGEAASVAVRIRR